MKRAGSIALVLVLLFSGCEELLEPKPVALLSDELALNEASDVPSARIGMYAALRGIASPKVLAGDFTADMLIHNGTFSQYREISNKEITASNATVSALWGSIYGTVYRANFVLERLPDVGGVSTAMRDMVTAEARFIRGYAFFIAYTSFGKAPLVLTTDINTNKVIARSSADVIRQQAIEDLEASLDGLPQTAVNAGFLTVYASYAALARLHLYSGNYNEAITYASLIIDSNEYQLEADYSDLVFTDFTDEAILEVGYSASDDPGSSSLGLNNLFLGRREIIPSNEAIFALNSNESGDRFQVLSFDFANLQGTDNGWSVAKYGTADENNNNIILFRLAEMYLIRAEARVANQDLAGAEQDINVLRDRANAPLITALSVTQMNSVVESERFFELAYEGHRWYDLKRTGRIKSVMGAYSQNWRDAYEIWPVPQSEIQNNPSLVGDQNPGY